MAKNKFIKIITRPQTKGNRMIDRKGYRLALENLCNLNANMTVEQLKSLSDEYNVPVSVIDIKSFVNSWNCINEGN